MSNVLDARAYAWCNLGPLSEEGSSIAEDHGQGAGVIMLKGTINLEGIYRPATGFTVHVAYSDGQTWIARLPIRLRVLSSFANPITDRTSVSVGCDLAYYENRKEPITLDTRDENSNVPEADWRLQTPAISAAWLVGMILCILRIEYVGTIPLTNYYTVQDFDMSAGYVEELGKLCASEGYVCRMNEQGKAEFIAKNPPIATGALLTEADLIDLNPINVGELPGDTVYAKYNSLKLKAPDSNETDEQKQKRNWEREESYGSLEEYKHTWTLYQTVPTGETKQKKDSWGVPLYNSFNNNPQLEQVYETKGFEQEEIINNITSSVTTTTYDFKDRAVKRITVSNALWGTTRTETYFYYGDYYGFLGENPPSSGQNGQWDVLTCNYQTDFAFPSQKQREASKDKNNGDIKREVTLEWSPIGPIRQQVGVQAPFFQVKNGGQYQSLYREVKYEKDEASGITKTTTSSLIPYIQTFDGSESISRERDKRQPWADRDDLVFLATSLRDGGTDVKIRTEKEFGIQRRPSAAERTTEANKKTPTVEQEARIAWALGSAASQTAIELSPPYTSDDRIINSNGTYVVIPSDAAQKALAYANTENRYLLGHRNGNGIQILPEMLPARPLSVIFIRMNGCTAAHLVNGRTWNIDPSGVTLTCDALFWGAVDGAIADAWFPTPPGLAALPAPVAITTNANPKPANAISIPSGFDFKQPNLTSLFNLLPTNQAPIFAKTVTPVYAVKPYNETVYCYCGSGSGVDVEARNWVQQPAVDAVMGSLSGVDVTSIGVLWESGPSTFTPGVPSLLAPQTTWVTNSTTFIPGIPIVGGGITIQITSATSLTAYTFGQLELSNFVAYSELVGGSMVLQSSGLVHTVEFFLPANTNGPITVAFGYDIDAGSGTINSVDQTYTGSASGNVDNYTTGFTQGDSYTQLGSVFAADTGSLLSIKHTITLD